ncbi:hypothetical protein WDU94_014296 [Cyamophila willieti]
MLPFGVETMGPWCQEAKSFVKKLDGLLATLSGDTRSKAFFWGSEYQSQFNVTMLRVSWGHCLHA